MTDEYTKQCPASLIIKGEWFPCEIPVGVMGTHQGWIPCVVITVLTEDGAGITGCFPADEQLAKIAADLLIAGETSQADVAAALADGTIQ